MKRALLALPAAALLIFASVSSAQAATLRVEATPLSIEASQLGVAAAEATCDVSIDLLFAPALNTEPQPATATGQNGVAQCSGTVDGETIDPAAVGTLEVSAALPAATCYNSIGSGTFTLTVTTTSGGTATITGAMEYTVLVAEIVVSGQVQGTGAIVAADGDCVTTPVGQVTAAIDGAVFTV